MAARNQRHRRLHWRSAAPLTGLVAGRNLTVEDTQSFTLHYGFGDLANWTEVTDANSVPLPFGMHGLTITAAQLNGHTSLNFIRRYGSTWDPKGNQNIPIVASAPTTPKQPLTPEVPRAFRTSHPLGWTIWKGEVFAPTEEELLTGIQG